MNFLSTVSYSDFLDFLFTNLILKSIYLILKSMNVYIYTL